MTFSARLFSSRKRAAHLGPYPLERLRRGQMPDMSALPLGQPLSFHRPDDRDNIVNAMADYQAVLDILRGGRPHAAQSEIPNDPVERANHLKAFGYFCDASMVGICRLPDAARLTTPITNPDVGALSERLATGQTKTLATGIDTVMADLRDQIAAPPDRIDTHRYAIVFLYENPRAPRQAEAGTGWIQTAQAQRGAFRANETAVVIGTYLRLLGWDAKSHSATETDVDLIRLAVASGLVFPDGVNAPFVGSDFGIAAITTTLELATDAPLAPVAEQGTDMRWAVGLGTGRSVRNRDPYATRAYADGPHPFETLKRVAEPTTYIDRPRVARVPKRADLFARAQFGDMGKKVQEAAKGGKYVRRAAPSFAQRRALAALTLFQDGPAAADGPRPTDASANAAAIKATAYWLGADAVGLSECPEWAWYSHDATGAPIVPTQDQAISIIIDQGFETMEGASGDDWISVAQSMRAYLRFSLLGGVLANQIRRLGYSAKAHTVMDGEVLQPPLLLLSGLGEVSRIGEVILNPFLGPRLKSGVITTDMPMTHDLPIDFGLQRFCESCNKCARECPSGAITAGPKKMFNGYEIWKSDSQKCATYRITTPGGAMCGRCMKTCPWNLEGLFAEAPFRWAAMHMPATAPALAKLDDMLGRGGLNPVKKWWWDIEMTDDGSYAPTQSGVNARGLQKDLKLRPEDQTLAVYPAPLAPPPWPYPAPMDREAGIRAYGDMISADEYRQRISRGDETKIHRYTVPGDPPVIRPVLSAVTTLTKDIRLYEFRDETGADLPVWTAGAHVDVVVAPEYQRQYSLCGDPADRSRYLIAVQREDAGKGGSALLHRIFTKGRRVVMAKPANHFELDETATFTYLMGGGIGITPMIAFAHRLHVLGRPFALHYSVRTAADAAFAAELAQVPWRDRVEVHISDQGSRADLEQILRYSQGAHVYVCGPDRYIASVIDTATANGFPEPARHLEYFSAPEVEARPSLPFTLRLRDGREVSVPADQNGAEALLDAGVHVDLKCSDGICGVCKCGVRSGAVDHRDHVLSNAQRETSMILCQSRAAEDGGVIEIDL